MNSDLVWYCFGAQSRRERAIAQMLRERGFKAAVPCVWDSKRVGIGARKGKRVWFKLPAIHGYVFVALDRHQPNLVPLYRLGMLRPPLEFDGAFARIEMDSFLRWMRGIGARPDQKPPERFKAGDTVVFSGGPTDQATAVVVWARGRRVRVRGGMFGGAAMMTVDASMLRLVESSSNLSTRENKCLTVITKRVNRKLTMGRVPASPA